MNHKPSFGDQCVRIASANGCSTVARNVCVFFVDLATGARVGWRALKKEALRSIAWGRLEKIGAELLNFIRTAIPSVWAVEILLFLRARSGLKWTSESVAAELRSNPNLVQKVLVSFEAIGLVRRDDGEFFYAPGTPLLDELSMKLERAYRERPVAVINAIFPSRGESLRAFSEAFRFKKDADE